MPEILEVLLFFYTMNMVILFYSRFNLYGQQVFESAEILGNSYCYCQNEKNEK
jgi:hypothetical protein